jgi:nitrogen regulatory protein P-II 1
VKMIVAYVQPYVIPRLTQELREIADFPGLSVFNCEGFGRERDQPSMSYSPFHQKRRIEIFAPEVLVETIVDKILQVAHSGNVGDGKVYIVDVLAGARIRTGERGTDVS